MTLQHITDSNGNDVCILVEPQPCTTPGYTPVVVNGQCICVPPPNCAQDVTTQIVVTPIEPILSIQVTGTVVPKSFSTYTVLLVGEAGGTIELSNDGGVTFTDLQADAGGAATYNVGIDDNAFISIIRYTIGVVVVVKQIVFGYFDGSYWLSSIQNCTQPKKAELIVTNANVLALDWVTTGVTITQQVGNTLYFTGCGTIGATVHLDCALANNTVEAVLVEDCVTPTYTVSPFDANTYMVTLIPNGILTQLPQWSLGTGLTPSNESQPPLMIMVSYDGVADSTLTVTTANTCGDVTIDIPFGACYPYASVSSCDAAIMIWQPSGEWFSGIQIFNQYFFRAFTAQLPLTVAGQQTIEDWLNNEVASVVGGGFRVDIIVLNDTQINRITYVSCIDDIPKSGVYTSPVNGSLDSVVGYEPIVAQLNAGIQLSVTPPASTYQWNLPPGVTLVLGTLTSPQIAVSGQGSVTVDVTYENCPDTITIGPVIVDAEPPVQPPVVQHNYTKLYHGTVTDTTGAPGNYTTAYTKNDVRVIYQGTGSIDGQNVTVDWGDGNIDVVPYANDGLWLNLPGMTIEHIYTNPKIHKVTTTVTDSQGLVLEDVAWFAFTTPIPNLPVVPDTFKLVGYSKEFNISFVLNGLDVTMQSGNGAMYMQPLVDDVRLQQQATIAGTVYPYTPAPPTLDSVGNVITHTLDNTPGTYDIRAEVTRLDVQGNNGDALNVQYTAYSQFQVKIL